MKWIQKHINIRYEFDGNAKRIEIREYPLEALREAVINAIVHRDYTNCSDIQIKVYDNSISIYNPGALYGSLSIDDIHTGIYSSSLRNKLMVEVFYRH